MEENKDVIKENSADCEVNEETTPETEVKEDSEDKHDRKHRSRKEKKLEAEIEELREELAKTQNMYYKAYADTENLKKRLQNDADTLRKYRIQSFAIEILPAIDNLERVLANEVEDEALTSYVDAVKMIYQQFMNALKNEGVEPIECLDKPFDPNFHHALVMEKVEGKEPGMVIEEIQKGYKLKDRVIRASLVKVSE